MQERELKPGTYWHDDLNTGDYFVTDGLIVTESHIVNFAGLSGDFFSLHMDDEFAREQGFPGRVAHGLLVLSLVDGLKNRAPVKLMAVASLGWNWSFSNPVVAGDRIQAKVSVEEKRLTSKRDRGVIKLLFTVYNQHKETVQEGTNQLLSRVRADT
ncbi:MaoC family dehydratase [Litchfieldella xinjiangensis]|uniref:MaoC family dehydratase n=1 Tax=Litchfieldella xinjiangensis TaxID=1166948 RepID=UPI0005BD8AE0|nr:MaoC/PaaZ C-terminal domain-containing protein [Halomonas xinjiangensis]